MTRRIIIAAMALAIAAPAAAPVGALAQPRGDFRWRGDSGAGWDPSVHYRPERGRERRMRRGDRIFRGRDGRFYCRRSDGTTGLVVGAVAGGILGNALGGNALSTILGAGSGAALGNAVDRGQVRCR